MLGENHSLLSEFPQFKPTIEKLRQSDIAFAEDAMRYDELDKEIRELELNNAPIDDDAMHRLKQHRAALKDSLYQQLQEQNKA